MANTSWASFFARNEFLVRRLHSASGLVPVGAFLCVHMLANCSVLGGAQQYQSSVDAIHSLGPALPVVEWLFIFLPLIFHAVVGVAIVLSGQPNTGSYPYVSNIRYSLQRATAWIALLFIFWHVFQMHGWLRWEWWLEYVARPAAGAQFDPHHATSSAALALAPLPVKILYAIGVAACIFHFANGLWTMGITWGLWTSPAAQRRANYICAVFGIALGLVGLGGLVGMGTVDVDAARIFEQRRIEQQHAQQAPDQHASGQPLVKQQRK